MKEGPYSYLTQQREYKNINLYKLIYQSLIYQWAKNLYTPENLLDDILYKISYLRNDVSWCIKYGIRQLNFLIDKNYKFYNEYKQYFSNSNKVSIRIGFISSNNLKAYQPLLQFYTKNTVIDFYQKFSKKNIICECFYGPDWNTRGCLILINGKFVDLKNKEELEQLLDHELNHYFQNLSGKQKLKNKNIKPSELFEKIAIKCGFDISSEDFKRHMLYDSQFIPMCSDVCNTLYFKI